MAIPRQPQSGERGRTPRRDTVYRNPADNTWRHESCWVRMGIKPKEAGYEQQRGGPCASCHGAVMHEFVWRLHKENAETLRKWAEALDQLVDKTFELVKCALIESRGNAVLEPGELARLCPDRLEAFQHAWKVAKATIEQEGKHPAVRYHPPNDASQFKDLAASFQLVPPPEDSRFQEAFDREVARGQTILCAVRPVPWLDPESQTDLFELAKRAALGAHSARAVRERADWYDKIRIERFGATEVDARNIAIERHKATAIRMAETRLHGKIPEKERHLRIVFDTQLARHDLSAEELRKCLQSEEFLARSVLRESDFRRYEQNKHEPAKNQLARILLMPEEFETYQLNPRAWNLGREFQKKRNAYRAARDRWAMTIESEARTLRVGKSRRRGRANS